MATSQDFEARRRERLQRQRKQREQLRLIKLIFSAALLLLIVILIISGISKCSKKTESQGTPVDSVTAAPISSEAPTVSPMTGIPAPEAGNNEYLSLIKRSGQKGHVYLTFDDGPDETITPQILDILRRYQIKATFFMVGKEIEKNPALCTRVMQEGHLAAPHSYTHVYDTVYSNEATFMNEVNKTYELITRYAPGGTEPLKLFRFPGGSSYTSTEKFAAKLAESGFYYCDWNSATGDDTNGVTKTASNLLYYFNQHKPQLNNLVILMHDSAEKQYTVDMLSGLIEQLKDEGWIFSRLDEVDFSNAAAADNPTTAPDSGSSAAAATSAPSNGTQPTTAPASGASSSGSAAGSSGTASAGSSAGNSTGSASTAAGSANKSTGSSGSAGSTGASSGSQPNTAPQSGTAAGSSTGSSSAAGSSSASAPSGSNDNVITSE